MKYLHCYYWISVYFPCHHTPSLLTHTHTYTSSQHNSLLTCLTDSAVARSFLSVVSGVIARDRVHAFERILWRATRGNIFVRSADFDQDDDVDVRDKSMFMIMYKVGGHGMFESFHNNLNTHIHTKMSFFVSCHCCA